MPVKTKNPASKSRTPITMRCMKCNEPKQVKKYEVMLLVSNRKVARGTCPDCGGNCAAMVGAAYDADRIQTQAEAKQAKNKKVEKKEAKKPELKALKMKARKERGIEPRRTVSLKKSLVRG